MKQDYDELSDEDDKITDFLPQMLNFQNENKEK